MKTKEEKRKVIRMKIKQEKMENKSSTWLDCSKNTAEIYPPQAKLASGIA